MPLHYATMRFRNNETILVNDTFIERRRNQEQRESKWTEREKNVIIFACLCYLSFIAIAMMCYVKFHPGVAGYNSANRFDSGVEYWSPVWRTAVHDYVNRRHKNKTSAFVDGIEIKCPEMYLLSDNKKLCYFFAKYRSIDGDYLALLVNKTDAVRFCNSFSNGTLPYGKHK